MKERKKKNGFWQLGMAFLALYAAVTLIPAAVYGMVDRTGKQAASRQPPEEAASSALSPPPSPTPEGFLDNFIQPGTPGENSGASARIFTLYDASADKTYELTAEELLPAAVACEMDLASPEEALKAQAVACYTFFCRKQEAGEMIPCDVEAWQTWTTTEHMQERWGEDFDGYSALLNRVVTAVKGQTLTQDGKPILASYFAISAGATEACVNVWEADLPYLQAAASPGDMLADGYLSRAQFSQTEFRAAAASLFDGEEPDFSGPPETWLTELEYTPSGYVRSALLGGKQVDGTALRSAFSLRSAAFQVEVKEGAFVFTVRGWGHGVGMSQTGAIFLAKQGASYGEILSCYYPGAVLTADV